MTAPYDAAFHDELWTGSVQAARRVLPVLFELWKPTSIVDVGCGAGAWLSVAAETGVSDLTGIDLPSSSDSAQHFGGMRFVYADLRTGVPDTGRTYDMGMSIEVAEHVPPNAGDRLVAALCRLAPVILFSAAFPAQSPSATGHVNEQFPSYWAKRFAAHGFEPREITRPRFWDDVEAPSVLQATMLLYVSDNAPEALRALSEPAMLDVVPPKCWMPYAQLTRTWPWRAQRWLKRKRSMIH
jgi:hypothetical protein